MKNSNGNNTTDISAKRIFCFCLSFLIILAVSDFLPVHGEEKVYNEVIRLHVLANSDSELDQSVKLKVRDSIIEKSNVFFSEDAKNKEEAEKNIKSKAEALVRFVDEVLAENGVNYKASIKLGLESYPERVYDGITYPAGEYVSFRILLGDGEGQNWWCVLFPPLCTDAAKAKESLTINTEAKKTFTEKETRYVFRLKILEIFKRFNSNRKVFHSIPE
ncbi:MAG: stage II sporulation protein R [Eubacteriales bacterium]|nr:stage II sporulation protein R [Eubacteriales bacterium]MDD4476325.1 stage II sporulation protein R [Eubacteriales bacterium]